MYVYMIIYVSLVDEQVDMFCSGLRHEFWSTVIARTRMEQTSQTTNYSTSS